MDKVGNDTNNVNFVPDSKTGCKGAKLKNGNQRMRQKEAREQRLKKLKHSEEISKPLPS